MCFACCRFFIARYLRFACVKCIGVGAEGRGGAMAPGYGPVLVPDFNVRNVHCLGRSGLVLSLLGDPRSYWGSVFFYTSLGGNFPQSVEIPPTISPLPLSEDHLF